MLSGTYWSCYCQWSGWFHSSSGRGCILEMTTGTGMEECQNVWNANWYVYEYGMLEWWNSGGCARLGNCIYLLLLLLWGMIVIEMIIYKGSFWISVWMKLYPSDSLWSVFSNSEHEVGGHFFLLLPGSALCGCLVFFFVLKVPSLATITLLSGILLPSSLKDQPKYLDLSHLLILK